MITPPFPAARVDTIASEEPGRAFLLSVLTRAEYLF